MSKTFVLDRGDALDVIYGDHEYFEVIKDTIDDTTGLSEMHTVVVQHKKTEEFFAAHYSQGLTEQQDEGPWDSEEPTFTQVYPVTKEVTVYE